MPRLLPHIALLLVFVIGFQIAGCLASGDCFHLSTGVGLIAQDFASDCDGCGCCHLHTGFEFIPPVPPWALNEFVPAMGPANAPMQTVQAPFLPPRS